MVGIKISAMLNARIPVCWNTAMLICVKWSQKVCLGHKTSVFSDISRLTCNKCSVWLHQQTCFEMAKTSKRRLGFLWSICMKTALGWSSTGESRQPEASCLHQRFVLLAAARITSTQFLSFCHQSLKHTREALGLCGQSRWCPNLPSVTLLCHCRSFVGYLACSSVSLTFPMSEHSRIHKLRIWLLWSRLTWSYQGAGQALQIIPARSRTPRLALKGELCNEAQSRAWNCLQGRVPAGSVLCEESRGSVSMTSFAVLSLLFSLLSAPWVWSGGSPCCALMLDHDGTWWRDLQQGFPLMAPPARWLQSTDQFSVLCVRSVCNLDGACSQLVLPFLCPPPPHAHTFPTDPFHASPFL